MSLSLEEYRNYTYQDVIDALSNCDVMKYRHQLRKITDLCLQMICFCQNNKPKFEKLQNEVIQEINAITTDEAEQGKLYNYVNRVMSAARNYLTLEQGY